MSNPETDALREAIDNGAATEAEMTSLAGKLERERNSLQDQRDFCMGEIERLRKERDDAREALDAVMGWAPQAPDYFNDKTKARWDDDMRKALKVLEATK